MIYRLTSNQCSNRFTGLLLGLISLLYITTSQAVVISYDIHWEGENGYTVVGMFSFDDSVVGLVAEESELISFMATAIDPFGNAAIVPAGNAFKTYDLTNQDSFFNFNFELASETILQSGFTTSSTGFFIGKGLAANILPDDWFFGGGTTGCADSGDSGIVLSIQSGCQFQVHDGLGTDFIATRKVAVSEPGMFGLVALSLSVLVVGRRMVR